MSRKAELKGGVVEVFMPGTDWFTQATLITYAGSMANWGKCLPYVGGSWNPYANYSAFVGLEDLIKERGNPTFASVKDADEPTRNEYIDMCSASYKVGDETPKQIGKWKLIFQEETIKVYNYTSGGEKNDADDNIDVIAIRGSKSLEDWRTNLGLVGQNAIPSGDRYKRDKESLKKFYKYHHKADRTFGCGHSLGGALLDRYIDEGIIERGLSINPAYEPRSTNIKVPNFRIYNRRDALYNLMGWMLTVLNPVAPVVVGSVSGWDYIPFVGEFWAHTDKNALKGSGDSGRMIGCGRGNPGQPRQSPQFDFECYW